MAGHDVKPGDLWLWHGYDYVVTVQELKGQHGAWNVWVTPAPERNYPPRFDTYMWAEGYDEFWKLLARR